MLFDESFYQSLPTKRISTGAIFQNSSGEYLLVKPHYRDWWQLPGGVVEEHELPYTGCLREVREELGLTVSAYRLICLDYNSSRPPATESVYFIFCGGVLSTAEISRIVLEEAEIARFAFADVSGAKEMVNERMSRRLQYCAEAILRNCFFLP